MQPGPLQAKRGLSISGLGSYEHSKVQPGNGIANLALRHRKHGFVKCKV